MSISAYETVRAQWTTELKTINGTGVYRNTVKKVYQEDRLSVPDYPSIIFLFGKSTLKPQDSSWQTVFNEDVDFFVVCFVTSVAGVSEDSALVAAQDSMKHDVLRVMKVLQTKNVNSSPSWIILKEPGIVTSPLFPIGQNTAWFSIYGTLRIMNMDGTLI